MDQQTEKEPKLCKQQRNARQRYCKIAFPVFKTDCEKKQKSGKRYKKYCQGTHLCSQIIFCCMDQPDAKSLQNQDSSGNTDNTLFHLFILGIFGISTVQFQ